MLGLALTIPPCAQQQSTSALWRGLVKNSVGTPIVGANVPLQGTSTAGSTTAADASFSLAALPAGTYKLTIVADGTTATYAQTIALTSDSADVAESLTGQFHRRFSEQFDLMIQGKGLNELKKYRLERISWRIAAAELPEEAFFGHHLSCIKDPARNGMTIYTSHAVYRSESPAFIDLLYSSRDYEAEYRRTSEHALLLR
jgi:Carboxypeptidase regulatory-like domain